MLPSISWIILLSSWAGSALAITCYEDSIGTIENTTCTCHPSCATCGPTTDADFADPTRWDSCFSCQTLEDFTALFPEDPADNTGICKGGCREQLTEAVLSCEAYGTENCFGFLFPDDDVRPTCGQAMAAICDIETTCASCVREFADFIECIPTLSEDEFKDLMPHPLSNKCKAEDEVPAECKIGGTLNDIIPEIDSTPSGAETANKADESGGSSWIAHSGNIAIMVAVIRIFFV